MTKKQENRDHAHVFDAPAGTANPPKMDSATTGGGPRDAKCGSTVQVFLDEDQRAAALLKALVEMATDCFFTIDGTGTVLSINRAVQDLFGYLPEELIGCDVTKLMSEPSDNDPLPGERRYIETNIPHIIGQGGRELCGRRKDGSEFLLELTLSEVMTSEGDIFMGILRDITERKQAEEALRAAKDAAETANRAKSDFLANMSHELTTPLNFIVGFSEVLLGESAGPLTAKQRNYLERILGGGKRLNNLLKDILDLSRVEAGTTKVSPVSFLLADLLRESLVLHKEKSFKHSITINMDIDNVEGLSLVSDPVILKKILFQLLSNAMKFTPDGGTVTLQAQRDADRAGWVILAVEDSGIGIAPENMPKLFTEFSQLESPYTKKYQGTGLGLALAKHLTELLGGTVQAQSRQGQGSRFSIIIPAAHGQGS